jgi:hypothetical protein
MHLCLHLSFSISLLFYLLRGIFFSRLRNVPDYLGYCYHSSDASCNGILLLPVGRHAKAEYAEE